MPPTSIFQEAIIHHVKAGYQVMLVPTAEENRAEAELVAAAAELGIPIYVWDQLTGWSHPEGAKFKNPAAAVMAVTNPRAFPAGPSGLMVMKDLHNFYFDDPDVRRVLRDGSEKVAFNQARAQRPVVLLQSTPKIPTDLAGCVTTIEFTLPTPAQLDEAFGKMLAAIRDASKRECSPELRYQIVQGLRGLTATEASNCLALCLIKHNGFRPEIIATVEAEKARMLRKTEVLTYTPRKDIPPISDLGGYDDLIDFVRQRALAYTPQAARIKLDMPKGVGLVGVPGTGKSWAAMGIANALGLPLLEFDFSSVFQGIVGASEARVREVIALVTAIDGSVLVIDEIDKAMGGGLESTGDSGVTRRVIGVLLSWLARKKDRTFVVFTMNRTKGLPPELIRKGRLDELFYVDVPTEPERRTIFEIHMRKRDIDPAFYPAADWKKFVKESADFVGSEIEQAVISARFAAFQLSELRGMMDEHRSAPAARKAELGEKLRPYTPDIQAVAFDLTAEQLEHMRRAVPTAEQILAAVAEVGQTKVTTIDKDAIEEIRGFGRDRGRPVSRERRLGKGKTGKANDRALNLGSPGDN